MLLGFLGSKDSFDLADVEEVVREMQDEAGGAASRPLSLGDFALADSRPMPLRVDIDPTRLQLPVGLANDLSDQMDNLGQERHGDRLLRLERSLLRIERFNLEILTMLQKLVNAVKKPQDESNP